jgi:hypothetical protein
MNTFIDNFAERMEKLSYVSDKKRSALAEAGMRHAKAKRWLQLLAGTLALLSGTTTSAVITKFVSPTHFSAIGAALAFGSGLISIITSNFFGEKDTARISEATAKYGELRELASLESIRPNVTDKQKYETLTKLYRTYSELDARFDHLIMSTLKSGLHQN